MEFGCQFTQNAVAGFAYKPKSDNLAAQHMRYWWVNQNQTFRQEQAGGYLWSPKRNANGGRNPFYESMREVAPGDVVFSFFDTRIAAIGVATSYCSESPKPTEFGSTGDYWSDVGWKVCVGFELLENQVRPVDHIEVLRSRLPTRYSPLQPNGRGNQGVYLTEVSQVFAELLVGLIGREAQALIGPNFVKLPVQAGDDLDEWEQRIERQIDANLSIPITEKESIIRARRGQGLFKERVMEVEAGCRITGVTDAVHLVGSHIIPWRDSTNEERLDGENGLLLTPSVDHLFDRGFIGFEGNGVLIISPVAHLPSLEQMGITTNHQVNVGSFTSKQKHFLEFHRDKVLKKSVRVGR